MTDQLPAAEIRGDLKPVEIEARELRKGDDLFGMGVLDRAYFVGGSVRVEHGRTGATLWPDEIVTVRRV